MFQEDKDRLKPKDSTFLKVNRKPSITSASVSGKYSELLIRVSGLFGSVTSQMISHELERQDLNVDKKEIVLDEPIKELGKHKVSINLGENLSASIQIKVNEESK